MSDFVNTTVFNYDARNYCLDGNRSASERIICTQQELRGETEKVEKNTFFSS